MSAIGLAELLVILGAIAIPCIGILVVGGIAVVIILLVRRKR
jgi:hypothetical protein